MRMRAVEIRSRACTRDGAAFQGAAKAPASIRDAEKASATPRDAAEGSMAPQSTAISRRTFMRWTAAAFATCALSGGMVTLAGCASGGSARPRTRADFVYGTTGYGVEMGNAGLDPHQGFSGWSAVRYGVGETLFRFSDEMEAQPWLAESWEFVDRQTVRIRLREGVRFTSGRALDAQAAKECLERLVAVHDRAPSDLKIASLEAQGQELIVHTAEPCPSLVNYLCDPYGAIVDVQAGADGAVAGTGPYRALEVSDVRILLERNEDYWAGAPQPRRVEVLSITDGDTLTMALQSGELDAVYGLPYASYQLIEHDGFSVSDCSTSRAFFCEVNFASGVMQDAAVRQALARGIDKEGFVETLLDGRGEPAVGPFPASMDFGDDRVTAPGYDPDEARRILEEAGWVDTDGDGVREKDGQPLVLRWLTYPGRQELPLLAESVQATLRDIGFSVQVNSTANHFEVLKTGDWDVYASAMVLAPTGDPEFFFTSCCLDSSANNYGGYHSDEVESLAAQLHLEFDPQARGDLAVRMSQRILDDGAYVFASRLVMGIVSREGVEGMTAHPCDYYEVTASLRTDGAAEKEGAR